MINGIEYRLLCLLTIFISSLEKDLFRSSTHFWIALFFFVVLELYELRCILEITCLCQSHHLQIFSLIQ